MEGRRMSFPIIRFTCQVRKVIGGIVQSAMLVCAVGYVSGLQDYSDFDWTELNLGLGNWTWACQYRIQETSTPCISLMLG